MKALVTLPIILDFEDYHEINYITGYMKKIIKGLKSKELPFCDGNYWAIFYLEKDEEYKRLVEGHKKLAHEYEKELYG